MFSLETGTLVHKGAAHSPGRPASRSGYAGDRALRRKSEEAGAKIAPVGKDVSMKVQANNAGTADQRREQMLRAALEVINERGYSDSRIADVAERAGTSRHWSSTTSRPRISSSPRRSGSPRIFGTRRGPAAWRPSPPRPGASKRSSP